MGRGTTAGLGGCGQSNPGQSAFTSVPQPPRSADDNIPVSRWVSTTQDANF